MNKVRWALGIVLAALSMDLVTFADDHSEEINRIERVAREAVEKDLTDSGERLTVVEIAQMYGDMAAPVWEAMLKDGRLEIRSKARSGLKEVGVRSSDFAVRQEALQNILSSTFSEDFVDANLQYLYGFHASDANMTSRKLVLDRLRESLEWEGGLRYECGVLLAAGRLTLEEAMPELRAIREMEKSREGKRPIVDSCAMLALARMGDAMAIRDCIGEHRSIENPEKRALLLGNLAYIRRQEIIQYLKEYLFSDAVYPSTSKDSGPVSDQWYAYLALQEMIVTPDDVDYTEFRAWMKTQTKYVFRKN